MDIGAKVHMVSASFKIPYNETAFIRNDVLLNLETKYMIVSIYISFLTERIK